MNLMLNIDGDYLREEIRNEYTVSSEMKRVWAVELDLLYEFQKVCEKHKLIYYACGGTLLGAIRHEGFIPWDDDIDLMMPRKDYDKLCKVASEEFKSPYFFQNDDTDYGFSRDFARLRNSSTTGIQKLELNSKVPYNQGIFIDIFPLDNVPDEDEKKRTYLSRIKKVYDLRVTLFRLSIYFVDDNQEHTIRKKARNFVGNILRWFFLKFKIKNPFLKKYKNIARKYNNITTKQWGLLWFYGSNRRADWTIWNKADFELIEIKKFEFMNINVPSGYENILTHQYGNWKVFVKGTNIHGNMFFDTEKSYSEYIKNYNNES